MSTRFSLNTCAFTFALCFVISTQAASAQTAPPDSLVASQVFQKNCAKCHGKTAEGRHFGGPSLISPRVSAASDDDLLNIISNGKGHMPKYSGKLSSEEIRALVQQIKYLNKK